MQVISDGNNSLSLVPTAGRRIINKFVDYETGYLVVAEISQDNRADRNTYYTLVDQQSGAIVDPHSRLQQVDTAEHVSVDRQHQLKITTQRMVDPQTGQEQILERIVDLASGKEVASKRSIAFSQNRRKTALESYVERLAENDDMKRFWSEEYPKKTLDERKGYWLEYIYRDMRTMGEVGQDEFSIFSRESYRDWKAKDPEIDRILDYVAEHLPKMWPGYDDKIRQKIQAMRG